MDHNELLPGYLPAVLCLAGGKSFSGYSIGYDENLLIGEVVFNTAMTGYQEVMTDPSYSGQMVAFTAPQIGNVGINKDDAESANEGVSAVIIRELSPVVSNYRSTQDLQTFLQEKKIVGIAGIDTRALTRHLREHGAVMGCIVVGTTDPTEGLAKAEAAVSSVVGQDLASKVTTSTAYKYTESSWEVTAKPDNGKHVVVYDFGVKEQILRLLVDRGCNVTVVPASTSFSELEALKPDGVVLSNGPGDPAACEAIIEEVKSIVESSWPIFGICLGCQLLAKALGGQTEKMPFGHHGANHPVVDYRNKSVAITSQNHGFVVSDESLPDSVDVTHRSLFDGTIQGFKHKERPILGIQGHPEGSPGPTDWSNLFDEFVESVSGSVQSASPSHAPALPDKDRIKSVLVIGAGPIVIGQACEFDYSGTQACQALSQAGYRVILVNSNPATIMTDPEQADATYIEPITWEVVERIIEKERPDALLPTMGGQTALNCALDLVKHGVLERYNVEMIGANQEAIDKAEDREKFGKAMEEIGLKTPRSGIAHSMEEAWAVLDELGFPAIIRPSFTMGGSGGGIAYNRDEFQEICGRGLDLSPTSELLIDESVIGWKEYELEMVRDSADNCIVICSIENIDPMGVHTGDSVTVAPAQTLTDKEYQRMREAAIAILRVIGVDTGGSNVQFAVNPEDGELLVVEMNPRVSRSSALASKATGFPIAKLAALLAVGYTLDELRNDVTGGKTPASFEPTIDYVVCKIPRFDFEKFKGCPNTLSTQMRSVGEVMAIGRTFPEALQKAIRGLETDHFGLESDLPAPELRDDVFQAEFRRALHIPVPERLWMIADAVRLGYSQDEIATITGVDPWFLAYIQRIVLMETALDSRTLSSLTEAEFRYVKQHGFADHRLAVLLLESESTIRAKRYQLGVRPVYNRIDTCAAEFSSQTDYFYSSYESETEYVESGKKKIIILGGGPNRIGQGIEFDYCCVHASMAIQESGYESVMINCNPETVSTDYDSSDRLFFESLTLEDVLAVVEIEKPDGVIVQFGGQTPLKLADALAEAGVPIIGTSPASINRAEDREAFGSLIDRLGLLQPKNGIVRNVEEGIRLAKVFAYPMIVRPSFVLGGRAMAVIYHERELVRYMQNDVIISPGAPLLLDQFLDHAIEVDVDAICDGKTVVLAGILEHIEQAGIHSGDSACAFPPHSLSEEIQDKMRVMIKKLALALEVVGLINAQFAILNDEIYILEVNPRASRTVPFLAKATGVPFAKIAAKCMLGISLKEQGITREYVPGYVAVKKPVFPFAKFQGTDPILGPEMRSTGEAMGLGAQFGLAFSNSLLADGKRIPKSGRAFISVRESDKPRVIEVAKRLIDSGFEITSTRGTAAALHAAKLDCVIVNKVGEGRPDIVDMIKNQDIQLIINTVEGEGARLDSFSIRRSAVLHKVCYTTTLSGAEALCMALESTGTHEVQPLRYLHQLVTTREE